MNTLPWIEKYRSKKINDIKINNDPNPEIIHKVSDQPIEYDQEIQVRFLKPPTPPPPGDIIIKEVIINEPVPPVIIRQDSPESSHIEEPIIIREAPPEQPAPIHTQIITVSNDITNQYDHKPRKLIVERMPSLPPKPQRVIIEKWLAYDLKFNRFSF